jgi:hypothetical protein
MPHPPADGDPISDPYVTNGPSPTLSTAYERVISVLGETAVTDGTPRLAGDLTAAQSYKQH